MSRKSVHKIWTRLGCHPKAYVALTGKDFGWISAGKFRYAVDKAFKRMVNEGLIPKQEEE